VSPYTAGLTIIAAGETIPRSNGNVLTLSDTTPPLGRTGGQILKSIRATWIAKDTLLVTYDPRARVVQKVVVFNTIQIRYAATPN
jgi:hypothetical protein